MASQITSLTSVYSTVYPTRRSKKTSKLRVTGLCEGNSHKGPVTRERFPFDDVIMRLLTPLLALILLHRLLLAKLSAYGLSNDSCNLLMSFLSERKQRVKIGNSGSSWSEIIKGVPQGSILGPLLFNVFINDVFYAIENVYNYADDNILSCSGDSLHEVATSLESSTRTALKWFGNNLMQANPSKFQAIVFGLKPKDDICFNVNDYKVKATKCVKQ